MEDWEDKGRPIILMLAGSGDLQFGLGPATEVLLPHHQLHVALDKVFSKSRLCKRPHLAIRNRVQDLLVNHHSNWRSRVEQIVHLVELDPRSEGFEERVQACKGLMSKEEIYETKYTLCIFVPRLMYASAMRLSGTEKNAVDLGERFRNSPSDLLKMCDALSLDLPDWLESSVVWGRECLSNYGRWLKEICIDHE